MSFLNINSANQGTLSGHVVITFESGGTLPVTIVGGLGFSTFVDVVDPDVDTRSVNNDSLSVLSNTYGYNDANNQWARIRAAATTDTEYSGFSMMTSIGEGGTIVDVMEGISDAMDPSLDLLGTASFTYGYHRRTSGWTRISSIFASGGLGVGDQVYSGYSLVVSVGDAGAIAHTTPTLTDGENADNSLFTAAFNMGYYHTGGYWSRQAGAYDGRSEFMLGTYRSAIASVDVHTESDVTAASGGEALPSQGARGATYVQGRITNSGWIRVGGNSAGDYPDSNKGFQLAPGESVKLYVSNWDNLRVIAQVSGDAYNVIGET